MKGREGTLVAPKRPPVVPKDAQWLSGQGAGVWFSISTTNQKNSYNIKRYSPEGNLDCDRLFSIEESDVSFDISKPYQFIHVSHCAKCRVAQNNRVFVFNFVSEETQ